MKMKFKLFLSLSAAALSTAMNLIPSAPSTPVVITGSPIHPAIIRERISSYLSVNLLTLTEKQIEIAIDEMRIIAAKRTIDERDLLEAVRDDISSMGDYHKKRQDEKKDLYALKWAKGLGITGIVLTGLAIATYFPWVKPLRAEMSAIYEQYTVIETKEKKGLSQMLHETIHQRSEEKYQYEVFDGKIYNKKATKRLVDLKRRNDWLTQGWVILGGTGVVCGTMGAYFFYKYYKVDPRHKERYEKLTKVKAALEKALGTPKKKITVQLEKDSLWDTIEQFEQDEISKRAAVSMAFLRPFYEVGYLCKKLAKKITAQPAGTRMLHLAEEIDRKTNTKSCKIWIDQKEPK